MSEPTTPSSLPTDSARSSLARLAAAAIALLGWYGLLLQLFVVIVTARANGVPVITATANYFSFFTILTNLLVALVLTFSLRKTPSTLSVYAGRATVQSAVAVYIAIVGIVYSLVLRNLWDPEGLQKIADVILHDAIPVLYLLYWLAFVRKGKDSDSLHFSRVPVWLAYLLLYLGYSLIRGSITGIYLYPFIDAGKLGYARVALNAVVLLSAFLGTSLLLVAIGLWMPQGKSE
ncbi:MAG: Pr6Pr family membrane protein [Acidobacteriia bacterium]|nr:Pr6Pr family membrane protein [Terriglobia bacterium]